MQSILTSIKKLLGITEEYDYFDQDLILDINAALAILTQLGVGDEKGFAIEDETATWSDFIGDDPRLNTVKSYVHHKVRLMFDPPQSSVVRDAINNMLGELEFRINVEVDPKKEENQNEEG